MNRFVSRWILLLPPVPFDLNLRISYPLMSAPGRHRRCPGLPGLQGQICQRAAGEFCWESRPALSVLPRSCQTVTREEYDRKRIPGEMGEVAVHLHGPRELRIQSAA